MRTLLATSIFFLSGCAALIGVKELQDDTNNPGENDDGGTINSSPTDGATGADGTVGNCSGVDTNTDPKNCGACGHDCFGGTCAAGKCGAVQLATIPNAPLRKIVVADNHVFVTSSVQLVTEASALWRIPKAGGSFEVFANAKYAAGMVVSGTTLHFVVYDYAANGGGLFSCDAAAAAPCTPVSLASAESPYDLVSDGTHLFFTDESSGVRQYTLASGANAPFREVVPSALHVIGSELFYTVDYYPANPADRATILWRSPNMDAGATTEMSRVPLTYPSSGALVGGPTRLFFSAYDHRGPDAGVRGAVRRLGVGGGDVCDYGGPRNDRPQGVATDAQRIYWAAAGTNLGDPPFTGGGIMTCAVDGCCMAPEKLWEGDGPRGVATDATSIYWVTDRGGVFRMAKPL